MQGYGLTTQHSVHLILTNIGLDVDFFCGKFLDVGCGIDANLVKFLRAHGIYAEGIDPNLLDEKTYLMQQSAHRISRPDNFYDMAASHMAHYKAGTTDFKAIVTASGSRQQFRHAYRKALYGMLATTQETLRVLKPGSKFVIYPEPNYFLRESKQDILRMGAEILTEESETPGIIHVMEQMQMLNMTHRAVLIKS